MLRRGSPPAEPNAIVCIEQNDMPTITQPVFSFWTENDIAVHNDLINHWRAEFPQFKIFGDAEFRLLMTRYFPDRIELYDNVCIPTAKSDIALLLLLYEFGGLYIDCHLAFATRTRSERCFRLSANMTQSSSIECRVQIGLRSLRTNIW
jgi:hypothetical protein